jgi:nitrate/nitrite-specific signal transduction histidine kinase
MTEQLDIQEFQLDLEQLHRRAVDLTRELGNVNYALREKRRELEMLGATLDARVHEQTQELKEDNERLREDARLTSIFWTIE